MKEKAIRSEGKKRRYVGSAAGFAAGYLVLLIAVFLIIVCNDPHGWIPFVKEHYANLIFIAVSVFFLVAIVYCYYFFEDRQVLLKVSNTVLVFTLFLFSAVLCYVFGRFVSVYARPFALFALLGTFLLNRKNAIFLNFIFSMFLFIIDMYTNMYAGLSAGTGGSAELTADVFATLMIGFASGTLAVFLSERIKNRIGLLATGVVIALPTCLVVLLLKLPALAGAGWASYLEPLGWRALGSIVSSVLALAAMPLFEVMFNRLTSFRLRELTSSNAPLLDKLKREAPGTFNHSLIVAQLAESCALAVGENAELARAAAYYHDVGKLKQPDCFTENQSGYNVHDELTPELSADIIRSHATEGYDLLAKAHLPRIIADVAREHHGTLPIKYFYDKATRLSGEEADIRDFSYYGPTPRSKISAIIMIADAAEAATRAMKSRAPADVERTVRAIIEERMDLGQFADCDVTMKELTTIKETLVDALSGVHHHRVEYPAIRFNRDKKAVEKKDKE